jgi:ABC-type glycerol-3-phosphate transport system substrate-binding protein
MIGFLSLKLNKEDIMKRKLIVIVCALFLILSFALFFAGGGKEEKERISEKPYAGVTLNVLLEDVSDNVVIEPYLHEFEEKTGIKVITEKVLYMTMHEKLVPQLMAGEGNGSYDFLQVDSYWVGEFVMAGWLLPLDGYLKETPEIKIEDYIDSVVEMFTIGDKTWFVPAWAYPLGLLYRTDIVEDQNFHKFYEKKTGNKWAFPPKDLYIYAEMAKAAKEYTPDDMFGCSMQGAKIDPIVMELTNYVYGLGGGYYDRKNWKASFNSKECKDALKIYKDLVDNAAQPGVLGANFEDSYNVFAQGKAAFSISHNVVVAMLLDPENSVVYDKVGFLPVPGGGMNGGWAWAIPVSSPNPDAAWEFFKWVESREMQKRRGMDGGIPTAKWVYNEQDFLEKYPFQKGAGEVLTTSKALPIISQSTRMVEIIGEYASRVMAGDISLNDAVELGNKELDEILEDDPLIEMQR